MNYPRNKTRSRQLLRAATPLALVVALVAGCGSSHDTASHNSADHSTADVSFATDMIQHHAQALSMVNLTTGRPVDPRFEAIATRIRDAQAPEIETMVDWLEEWDEDVPETMNDHMNHDMGTMPKGSENMPGMMSADEMDALERSGDGDFQALWLEMMIRHHEGAVQMAREVQANGQYQPALDLAASIISSQVAEIAEMKELLTSL